MEITKITMLIEATMMLIETVTTSFSIQFFYIYTR